jgi:CoA:oxalate CoA-transferase
MSAAGPLVGVRVLDMARVVSGPVVGRIMADLGADVVKIEPPEGDITRVWGARPNDVPGFFLQQNAGKRGMCIDLAKPGAASVVQQLARTADVLIENFRGGVMERLGLGWEVLQRLNPQLVMLSITGFGQTGPEAHRPAYASVIQAEAGMIGRLAETDHRDPTDLITSVADYNAGLHGCIAALAALHRARATGRGDHIDLAMIDAMIATDDFFHFALDEVPPPKLGGEYYQTGDGAWTVISGPVNHCFRTISAHISLPDPTSATDTVERKIELRRDALRRWSKALPDRQALTSVLDEVNIAWGAMKQPQEAASSPTILHRKSIATVSDGPNSTRAVVRMPYRFDNSSSEVRGRSPHLGEHNAHVLSDWLGWIPAQATELEQAGVLLKQQ